MSKIFLTLVVAWYGAAGLQAQTLHRPLSSIFSSHLAQSVARADTLTLAPTIRAAQPMLQAFLGGQRLSAGTWIEIYGSNFAAAQNDWSQLFVGDKAPTSIDDIRVNIDGKPAYMFFITPGGNGSPSQINALVPDGIGLGPVMLEVVTPAGRASTIVTASQITPAMLTTPAFNVGGKQYVAALFATDLNQGRQVFVGRPNLIAGAAFRPAKPGDVLTIFAVGCGPTNPASPAGTIVSGLKPLANPLQIRFGETVAESQGFLSPGAIGLCQLNVTVPNVADGDIAITTSIGSVPDGQNLFTTIQR